MKKIVASCSQFLASLTFTVMIFAAGCSGLAAALFAQKFSFCRRLLFLAPNEDVSRSAVLTGIAGLLCLNVCACCVRHALRCAKAPRRGGSGDIPADHAGSSPVRRMSLPADRDVPALVERELRQRFGNAVQKTASQGGCSFCAERGVVARSAFFTAHLSIVAVLAGALLTARSYELYCDIGRGERIDPLIVADASGFGRKLPFGIQCDDFFVPQDGRSGDERRLFCRLAVIEGGTVKAHQTLDFSQSLRSRGYDIYLRRGAPVRECARIAVTDAAGAETVIAVRNGQSFLLPGSSVMMQAVSFKHNALRVRTSASPSFLWIGNEATVFSPTLKERYMVRLMKIDQTQVACLTIAYDPGKYVLWTGVCCGITGFFLMFVFPRRRVFVFCENHGNEYTVTVAADGPRRNRDAAGIAEAICSPDHRS